MRIHIFLSLLLSFQTMIVAAFFTRHPLARVRAVVPFGVRQLSSSTLNTTEATLEKPEKKKKRRKRSPQVYPPPPSAEEFPDWSFGDRDFFRFEILHESTKSQARVGRIHTPHGVIDTPGFVAVATNAALKGVDFRDADEAGQQLIFSNTYHLLLHPGADVIESAGGIHAFTKRSTSCRRTCCFVYSDGISIIHA